MDGVCPGTLPDERLCSFPENKKRLEAVKTLFLDSRPPKVDYFFAVDLQKR